jgi:hypothetical protein
VCELVGLKQDRAALALANEALQDDPGFTLPDATVLAALMNAGQRAGLLRQMATLGANYGLAFPRRYDGLAPGLVAATLWADRLSEPQHAREILTRGAALADGGTEAAEVQRLQNRLDAGLPLGDVAFAPTGGSRA